MTYEPWWFGEIFKNYCPANENYTFCNATDERENLTWFLKKLYYDEGFTVKFNVSIAACVDLKILENQESYGDYLCHPNGTCYPGQNMTIKHDYRLNEKIDRIKCHQPIETRIFSH